MVSGFIRQSVWMLCYSCIFSFPNLVLEALLSAGSTSLLKLVAIFLIASLRGIIYLQFTTDYTVDIQIL